MKYVMTSYNLRDSENKLAVPLPRTIVKIAFSYSGAVEQSALRSQASNISDNNDDSDDNDHRG